MTIDQIARNSMGVFTYANTPTHAQFIATHATDNTCQRRAIGHLYTTQSLKASYTSSVRPHTLVASGLIH